MAQPSMDDIVKIIYQQVERTLNDFIVEHSKDTIAPNPIKLERSSFGQAEVERFLLKISGRFQ